MFFISGKMLLLSYKLPYPCDRNIETLEKCFLPWAFSNTRVESIGHPTLPSHLKAYNTRAKKRTVIITYH